MNRQQGSLNKVWVTLWAATFVLAVPSSVLAQLFSGPNGHLYEVVISPGISGGDAEVAALGSKQSGISGQLAAITSLEEDLFLDVIRSAAVAAEGVPAEFWVGGFQAADRTEVDQGWYWGNGEGDFVYTNWLTGEPSDGYGPIGQTQDVEDNEENQIAIGLLNQFGWNDEVDAGSGNIGGYIIEYSTPARVTGGGWIIDPETGDKANFGLVAMNQKSNGGLHGQLEFQTKALNFHGSDTVTLVVAVDGTTAQFSGHGSVNGEDGYDYTVFISEGQTDTLQIEISLNGDLFYDSGSQPLGGGNTTIRLGKKKK